MRVLFFNEPTILKGGIDVVINSELKGLSSRGIDVKLIEVKHKNILEYSFLEKVDLFINKGKKIKTLKEHVIDFKPDVIHIHNIFPFFRENLWTDRVLTKYKKVFHLHNFYPVCLNSFCYINGNVCNYCMTNNNYYHAIKLACYDNSKIKTYITTINRPKPKEWLCNIFKFNRYIAVSKFLKEKYTEFGIDESIITDIPNGIEVSESVSYDSEGSYVLFLGNVVLSKGIEIVCQLAAINPAIKFVLAGSGRDLNYIMAKYKDLSNIEFVGYVENEAKANLIKKSKFMLFPNQSWEAFGLVILESLNYGKPVITSGFGGTSELVTDGINGIIVHSNELEDYNSAINSIWNNKTKFSFEQWNLELKKHSFQQHINSLVSLYEDVLSERGGK